MSKDLISAKDVDLFRTLIDGEHENILFLMEQPSEKKKFEAVFGMTDYRVDWCNISKKSAKLVQFHRWFDVTQFSTADDLLTFYFAAPKATKHSPVRHCSRTRRGSSVTDHHPTSHVCDACGGASEAEARQP
jgi:hypothetical protein